MTNYYALVNGEKVIPLGPCECFCEADEKAPSGTNWIYDEEGIKAMLASAKEAGLQ